MSNSHTLAWTSAVVPSLRRTKLSSASSCFSTPRRPRRSLSVLVSCASSAEPPARKSSESSSSSSSSSSASSSPSPSPSPSLSPSSSTTPDVLSQTLSLLPNHLNLSPHVQVTLLTDSVLELKWKNERHEEQLYPVSEAPHDDSRCSPLLADDCDDLTASDPYKAFAQFTRIAAPTAAIGRHRPPLISLGDNETSSTPLASSPPSSSPSYSTADIALRLLRYTKARDNLQDFVSLFVGDFDNGLQTAAERSEGLYPGEGGGHEHIHCVVREVAPDLLFARYYFNGDPSFVFRTRLYRVRALDASDRGLIEMRILRFREETERALKATNYDLDAVSWIGDDDTYVWLQGCEVYWERYSPTSAIDEAAEALGIAPGDRFVGYMAGGGCKLYSKEINAPIQVMDDLLLTTNELWVADRGFDDQNRFVYGNRRGIPYKMCRVRPGDPLSWTLSASDPPPTDYIP